MSRLGRTAMCVRVVLVLVMLLLGCTIRDTAEPVVATVGAPTTISPTTTLSSLAESAGAVTKEPRATPAKDAHAAGFTILHTNDTRGYLEPSDNCGT